MISIPTTFRLGGRKWTVVMQPLVLNSSKILGATDSDDCIIYLKQGLQPGTLYHTFFHELEHAIRATLGLEDEDEGQVDARGGILYQFLDTKRGNILK